MGNKRYSTEFREKAVRQVIGRGCSTSDVAGTNARHSQGEMWIKYFRFNNGVYEFNSDEKKQSGITLVVSKQYLYN